MRFQFDGCALDPGLRRDDEKRDFKSMVVIGAAPNRTHGLPVASAKAGSAFQQLNGWSSSVSLLQKALDPGHCRDDEKRVFKSMVVIGAAPNGTHGLPVASAKAGSALQQLNGWSSSVSLLLKALDPGLRRDDEKRDFKSMVGGWILAFAGMTER